MSTTTQPPQPKRRWCQFSLRTLLLLVTVATLTFGGWVQFMRYRARENRARVAAFETRVAAFEKAVAAIEELGGQVDYSIRYKYEKRRPPTWLEDQFDDPGDGDDPGDFGTMHVYLSNAEITDAELELFEGLMIQYLDLSNQKVTDAGLEHLKGLTSLRELYLYDTNVTNDGVKKLQQALPNCEIER